MVTTDGAGAVGEGVPVFQGTRLPPLAQEGDGFVAGDDDEQRPQFFRGGLLEPGKMLDEAQEGVVDGILCVLLVVQDSLGYMARPRISK